MKTYAWGPQRPHTRYVSVVIGAHRNGKAGIACGARPVTEAQGSGRIPRRSCVCHMCNPAPTRQYKAFLYGLSSSKCLQLLPLAISPPLCPSSPLGFTLRLIFKRLICPFRLSSTFLKTDSLYRIPSIEAACGGFFVFLVFKLG